MEGSDKFRKQQQSLCKEFAFVFSRELRREPADLRPMDLVVDRSKWEVSQNRRPPYQQGAVKAAEIRKQVKEMEAANIIGGSSAAAVSQELLVKQSENTFRFCVDYRRLNLCTTPTIFPIPNIQSMMR